MPKPLTDIDQLLAYYFDKSDRSQLDERLREKLGKLEFAQDLFREWGDKSKVVKLVMAKYQVQKSQAYQLVQEAQQLFAITNRNEKEFVRALLHDWSLKLLSKCVSQNKLKEAAAIIAQMVKIHGLDRDDPEVPDFSQLQPVPVHVAFQPELLGVPLPDDLEAQLQKIMSRKKGLKFNADAAEDAEVVS